MSIQKPYNVSISGTIIDANEDNFISWSVSGAIQYAKSLTIKDNIDNTVVFTIDKTPSFLQNFTVPANTLTNNKQYKIQVTVWDEADNSATSDSYIFETSARPTVSGNIPTTITAQKYVFEFLYNQVDSISMRSWIIYIYNSNKELIGNSGIQLAPSISYEVDGLQSEESYYVECQVTSNKGLVGTTGLISFNVLYTQPRVNVQLVAENYGSCGIRLNWKVIQIIGTAENPSPPIYINGDKVDLTGEDSKIYFDEGFSVDKDFTLKIWLENPNWFKDLLIIKGQNGQIRLRYNPYYQFFELYKELISISFEERYVSEVVTSNNYFVCIQQVGSNLVIHAENNV